MNKTLALTSLLMGLVGGPHCLAMCGAACAGIGRAAQKKAGGQATSAMLLFQLGRITGYSALGALAATTMDGVGWLSTQSAVFRPLWTFLHIMALMVGLLLLWRGEQPVGLGGVGSGIWRRVQVMAAHFKLRNAGAVVLGILWALMPCGLLYGALLVAALSSSPLEGAGIMALFALGGAVMLAMGPWLWLRLRGAPTVNGLHGAWGVRLAGTALAISSGWALWMGLVEYQAPWCLVPQ